MLTKTNFQMVQEFHRAFGVPSTEKATDGVSNIIPQTGLSTEREPGGATVPKVVES